MDDEERRKVARIVGRVWPEDSEIVGEPALLELADDPQRFRAPGPGDHIDLMPIFEVLKGAVELVAACVSLYVAVRSARGASKADGELADRLEQAVQDRVISPDQAEELRTLIKAGA